MEPLVPTPGKDTVEVGSQTQTLCGLYIYIYVNCVCIYIYMNEHKYIFDKQRIFPCRLFSVT